MIITTILLSFAFEVEIVGETHTRCNDYPGPYLIYDNEKFHVNYVSLDLAKLRARIVLTQNVGQVFCSSFGE